MNAIAIDVAKRSWNAALTEQMHQSVDALGVVDMEIPKHAVVWNIRLRVPLVRTVH